MGWEARMFISTKYDDIIHSAQLTPAAGDGHAFVLVSSLISVRVVLTAVIFIFITAALNVALKALLETPTPQSKTKQSFRMLDRQLILLDLFEQCLNVNKSVSLVVHHDALHFMSSFLLYGTWTRTKHGTAIPKLLIFTSNTNKGLQLKVIAQVQTLYTAVRISQYH